MIIADSDVLIDYLRNHGAMAARVELELQTRSFGTTAVTAAELWAGARSPRQVAAVEAVLGAMDILPLDAEAAKKGGEVRRDLLVRGEDIGMADCLIAGICMTRSCVLLTRNRRHFERISGLKLSIAGDPDFPDQR